MKLKKEKKLYKEAKKLVKKIKKHGKDGEKLLMEIKKLLEPGKAGFPAPKAPKKQSSKAAGPKRAGTAPKVDRPLDTNPPTSGSASVS